jgi:FKBP-type peptidyl-prolyl cis-trans isomerase (trigger factor)
MKWEQHPTNDGFHRLRIKADWSELSDDYADIVSEYQKLHIKGFRPGKTPRTLIEKRFQKEIMDDLSRRAAQRLGHQAVREVGAEVLGAAEVEAVECDKEKVFWASVVYRPMPEIDLPDLDTLTNGKADGDLRDWISLRLLERVPFEIPDNLVADELARDGEKDIDHGSPAWQAARDRIRLMLILRRIAKQEGIEVDQSDVEHRIAEKAEEFGATARELEADLARGDGLQRLKDMLLAESALTYLVEINTERRNL